jgi:hypothetical protein
VYFEKKPIQDTELSKIPNKFRGLYQFRFCLPAYFWKYDSKRFYRKFRIHKTEIDSLKNVFDFVNGRYVSNIRHDLIKIGDSVELSYVKKLIRFIFSNTQKAKI